MHKNFYSRPVFLFSTGSGEVIDVPGTYSGGFGDVDDENDAKKSRASDWSTFWNENGETITSKSNFDLATPETYPEGFDPSDVTTYDTLLEDQ